MRYLGYKLLAGIAIITAVPAVASAQMGQGMGGPGMGGPGMGGPQTPAGEEKKEGVATAAPKTPGLLPTTPALPPQKSRRKRYQLFELNGYFRMRTYWDKDYNLGYLSDPPTLGGAPFPQALGCNSTALNHPCNDSLSTTDMRLRLEPVINLDEGTSVHVQADVFDNLILGSTPTGEDLSGVYTTTNKPPVVAFGNTQTTPVQGINSVNDAILVKRAWGEVAVPLGVIKFGRQPNSWGMGIWLNSGGYDPISGQYDYDGNYGDSVDRVSFSGAIPGTPLRAMIAADWDSTLLVSNQTSANKGHEEQPFDLDDSDDTNGWVGVISKLDTPQDFHDIVERGETALNYGVYFEYKTQSWDDNLTGFNINNVPTGSNTLQSSTQYVPRDLKSYTTDLWGKLGTGGFTLEGEFVAQLGTVNMLQDYNIPNSVSIRKFGGVGRFTWTGVEGKLRLGLESGAASGDQWDNTPQGNTNIAFANQLGGPGVTELTQFMFNREYKVDLILWRQLIGAVTNAVYIKPFLNYDLTKQITFKAWNVTSFALKPVATPGNDILYGTEFDGDLGFTTGRISAGLSFGVLFPFGAMSHPQDNPSEGGPGFGYGTNTTTMQNNFGDPSTAYTVQSRLVLAF